MMDDLICSVENFKALIEFKGKYFDGDRQAQWTVPQKELCKKYEGFGQKSFSKLQMRLIKLTLKLISEEVLFNKGVANPTYTFHTIFPEHLSLPICTSLF